MDNIESWSESGYLLPPWAASKITPGQVMVPMAHLSTKDGRACGNAVLADIVSKTYDHRPGEVFTYARIVTDAGNILLLTENELTELFHPPQYVMRKLLPAHKKALKEKSRT